MKAGMWVENLADQLRANRRTRGILAALVSLPGSLLWPQMLRTSDLVPVSNSVFSVVLAGVLAAAVYHALGMLTPRRLAATLPLGVFFSLCMALGAQLCTMGDVYFGSPLLYLAALFGGVAFCALLMCLWNMLDGIGVAGERTTLQNKQRTVPGIVKKVAFPLSWAFILLCWVPSWLAAWPGYFCYDAGWQFRQYIGGAITTHHPPLHTFLLGFLVESFENLLGSYNAAVALYLFLQMFLISGVLAATLREMRRLRVPKGWQVFALAYYALHPLIAMLANCSTKDSLFSAVVLLFALRLLRAGKDPAAFFASRKQMAAVALAGFFMLALRNNAPFAFVVFAPVAVLLAKGWRLKTAALLAGVLAVYLVFSGPVFALLGVGKGDAREMLGIPMQQLARTYRDNPGTFTQQERNALYRLIPEEGLLAYQPKLADNVKDHFKTDVFLQNKGLYIGLWLRTGLKNPGIYIKSVLHNTVDLWYPDSIVNGYNIPGYPIANYAVGGGCYFLSGVEPPATFDGKIPWLLEFYQTLSWKISFQRVPVLAMLFSPGFLLWTLCASFCFLIYKKRREAFLPLLFLLLLTATVVFGQMVLPRYVLYLYFAFPLLAGLLLAPVPEKLKP